LLRVFVLFIDDLPLDVDGFIVSTEQASDFILNVWLILILHQYSTASQLTTLQLNTHWWQHILNDDIVAEWGRETITTSLRIWTIKKKFLQKNLGPIIPHFGKFSDKTKIKSIGNLLSKICSSVSENGNSLLDSKLF